TPPTQGFLAGMVAKKLGAEFVYNLQDIFPDSMVNAGMTKKGSILWKIGRKIEDFSYRSADKIIVISEDFKKNIMAKGVTEDKIEVIPNWADTDRVAPVPKKDNRLYSELSLDADKFTVLYAGNFGASQGADIVIKAAELLQNQSDIQFVVFGGGSEYEKVREYVSDRKIENIKLFDLLPIERVSEVYSLGDIAIISGKKGIGKSGMPSKTWTIMACNVPILASFDTQSELGDLLRQTGAGICIEPENVSLLADTIAKIYNSEIILSPNGRSYVMENASKEKCAERYVNIIEDIFRDSKEHNERNNLKRQVI
ncbi:MAG: glycosyltransferase family 4 protein, partial [Clostridia bacterium]|nr:glycosyltransferase family 4 protein [Clostridia bacterium]